MPISQKTLLTVWACAQTLHDDVISLAEIATGPAPRERYTEHATKMRLAAIKARERAGYTLAEALQAMLADPEYGKDDNPLPDA